MMTKSLFVKVFVIYFTVLSILGLVIVNSLKNSRLSPKAQSSGITPQLSEFIAKKTEISSITPKLITSGKPVRMVIPRINIDLQIVEGFYSNNNWNVSNTKAQWATMTAQANDYGGDTLLYGHNTPAVFRKTKDLVPGDLLRIYTENGLIFDYTFMSSELVVPTDTRILNYKGSPIATLLTCDGILDSNRRLMHFEFKEVKKQ